MTTSSTMKPSPIRYARNKMGPKSVQSQNSVNQSKGEILKEGRFAQRTQFVDSRWKGEIKQISFQLLMKLLIGKRRLICRIRRSRKSGWRGVPDLWSSMLKRAIGQLAA